MGETKGGVIGGIEEASAEETESLEAIGRRVPRIVTTSKQTTHQVSQYHLQLKRGN